MTGRLSICATPIGNLEDVTHRLLRVLAEADIIAAEDTRQTRKLLDRYGIGGKVISYHDANERQRAEHLVDKIRGGAKVALVSDAGMPGISDPGYHVITKAIDAMVPIEVVPGPSSVPAALVVSGLPTARFSFEGFLPRKKGEATRRLEKIANDDRTLLFFEAAGRVPETLDLLLGVFSDRRAALVRELTKVHEQVLRGTLASLIDQAQGLKGEVVIVVEGALDVASEQEAIAHAIKLVADGMPKSRAAAEAAARFGVTRKKVYDALVQA